MIICSEFKLCEVIMEKQTTQPGFECVCCKVLQGMVTFHSFQSTLRFAGMKVFVHSTLMDPLNSLYRAVKEKAKKCEQGGESDIFTPSCQFVCLSRCPIPFSHSLIVPHLVLVFGFHSVKSKPGQAVSPGMKDGRGHRRGDESRGWERPGLEM